MTKKIEAKVFIERIYCDGCGSELSKTGRVYESYPEKYEYECRNPLHFPETKVMTITPELYPKITYEL